MKVFVIDDDKMILDCYKMVMAEYEVKTFISGKKAIAALEESTPDVIICDLCMPFMDGYQATDKIREKLPGVPIIIASAMEPSDVHSMAAKLKGYKFWKKGGKYDELKELIQCQTN